MVRPKKGSKGSAVAPEGNTKPLSRKKDDRPSPAIRWCFTLHNPTEKDHSSLCSTCSEYCRFYIWAEELGAEDETFHLQGYIEFKQKRRPLGLFENKTIKWIKCKGNKKQNVDYIHKEGGKCWIDGKLETKLKIIDNLYEWQQDIINIISEEPDDRTIYWIHEETGCRGKSALAKLLVYRHNAIILSGKASDMKNGIMKMHQESGLYPPIVVIDVPRCIDTSVHLSYTGIEEIKNGCFFSPKYEGGMCIFNSPHVLVFSNDEPCYSKLSMDRWKVISI